MTFRNAWAVLQRGIEEGAFPGAVAVVADARRIIAQWHGGHAAIEPDPIPMQPDMIFDVASLTKVAATLPAILSLVEDGKLSLDERISRYVAQWSGPDKEQVTVRHLLTHTSGLPAWHPVYATVVSKHKDGPALSEPPAAAGAGEPRTSDGAVAAIAGLALASPPGTKVEYSCLGFILLGHLIEIIAGQRLDDFTARRVFAPLGMQDAHFRPIGAAVATAAIVRQIRNSGSSIPLKRIVPTERGGSFEHASAAQYGVDLSALGGGLAHGVVHDGNARFGLAGISGNAGLFATAADLVAYGQHWLRALQGRAEGLSQPLARLATTDHTPHLETSRGLGWLLVPTDPTRRVDGPTDYGPRSCGELLSPGSFGHTGFTGTSLWIDPVQELIFVLLTNRVHPHVRDGLAYVRPRFHNAAVAAALDVVRRKH